MEFGTGDAKIRFEAHELLEEETRVLVGFRDRSFSGSVLFNDELYAIPNGGRPPEFFRGLADAWRGWEGERRWCDVSCSFAVTAKHNGVGQVTLEVTLRREVSYTPWASLTGSVVLDPGQLDQLASTIEQLFERGWHPSLGRDTVF